LRDAVAQLAARVVALDPAHLVNVNSPDDLTRVQERAHAVPSG
jgi:CTP:molybdopterin cytidylyltransferase MocA